MSGLFGTAASSSANPSNALGELKNDVALNNPPEDSISDLAFSPQADYLAVASWDKKVRIYEINASGGSEGRAMFEHEAPVLSCHWSPVSCLERENTKHSWLMKPNRMDLKSWVQEQTKLHGYWICEQAKPQQLKWQRTTSPFAPFGGLRLLAAMPP